MLQTIGTGKGVFEAITRSIHEANPSHVCFFASQGSLKTLDVVFKKLEQEKYLEPGQHEVVPVPDINDHNAVFQNVVAIVDREKEKGIRDLQFIVDYTSGTKAMSVGLALAATACIPGCSFRYVGSLVRDETFGRVFSGEEDIKIRRTPAYYLGYEEERLITFLFNRHRYLLAMEIIDKVVARNPSVKLKNRLTAFRPVCEWLQAWDDFNFAAARKIAASLTPANLAAFAIPAGVLDEKRDFLDRLCRQSHIADNQSLAVPSHEMICDLYQNARRRLVDGLAIDAWVRGARLHLMILQFLLQTRFGIDPMNPDPAAVKKYLRKDGGAIDIRKGPIGRKSATDLLLALEPGVEPALVKGNLDPTRSLTQLGVGFEPAPDAQTLQATLDSLMDAFKKESASLESSAPVDELMRMAAFPTIR